MQNGIEHKETIRTCFKVNILVLVKMCIANKDPRTIRKQNMIRITNKRSKSALRLGLNSFMAFPAWVLRSLRAEQKNTLRVESLDNFVSKAFDIVLGHFLLFYWAVTLNYIKPPNCITTSNCCTLFFSLPWACRRAYSELESDAAKSKDLLLTWGIQHGSRALTGVVLFAWYLSEIKMLLRRAEKQILLHLKIK